MVIKYQDEFEAYLRDKGTGSADKVEASVRTCIASLNSVAKHLGITISNKVLSTESDIAALSVRLGRSGRLSAKNIKYYGTAMQQYVDMLNGK